MAQLDLSSVQLGLRVKRGRDWRNGKNKWRHDMCDGFRCAGTVIGYTDENGILVGENTQSTSFDTFQFDHLGAKVGPAWCAVKWDNGKESIYPIGSQQFLGDWWTLKSGMKLSGNAETDIPGRPKAYSLEIY